MDRRKRRFVAQVFQPAGSRDFPVLCSELVTGNSPEPAGWKACPTCLKRTCPCQRFCTLSAGERSKAQYGKACCGFAFTWCTSSSQTRRCFLIRNLPIGGNFAKRNLVAIQGRTRSDFSPGTSGKTPAHLAGTGRIIPMVFLAS